MANMQTTLETIFMEAAKVFGKTDAEKLLTKVFENEKPAKEEKKKEDKPKTETAKRISRMTPTLANQLKAELIKVGLTFPDDDKKEFDKIKKEFVAHVDGLTDDDFTAKGLADHMRDFANLKKPAPAPGSAAAGAGEEEKPKKGKAKKEDPPAEKKEEDKPKKGKAAKKEDAAPPAVEKKKTMWEEMNEVKAPPPPSNAANIHDLTLEELQGIEMLATPEGGPVGVYWDADDGRWVRGPEQDDDEDLTEKKFKGKTYAIGDITGRIYETTDDRDVFVGFAGVGAFRELK
jgi:hypothetical protein